MEYVFSGFNLTNLLFALIFCGLMFLLRGALRKWWMDGLGDTEQYDAAWAGVHRRERILDRILKPVCAIPFIAVIALGAAHAPQRTLDIELHKEMSALIDVVRDAIDLRFTEQCSFNGFSADADGKGEVYPCNTFGSYRIWRTTVSTWKGGTSEHFHVGITEGQYMRKLLLVNFYINDLSTLSVLPQHWSSLSIEEARKVREAIRTAMPKKADS